MKEKEQKIKHKNTRLVRMKRKLIGTQLYIENNMWEEYIYLLHSFTHSLTPTR